MGNVDPTYPLYPIASTLASTMLLLVLMTNLIRQKWNLGVASLCSWLFLENLALTINHVIWSDNAEIRLYVYCDIATHLQMIANVIKPMATLIITRRLYLIASLQSVELPSRSQRRWDLAVEWTLGLTVPLLVAVPIYYVNQGTRFGVIEGFGCVTGTQGSISEVLMIEFWTIVPPFVSIILYYPKIAHLYYHQRRDINSFLRSNRSVSRTNYIRILALASIDILLTLPFALVTIALEITNALHPRFFPFYPGWDFLHSQWEPVAISYEEQQSLGASWLARTYFSQWTSPILAFAIFGLFGVTSEARASYWRIICTVGGWFGWKPASPARNGRAASLREIELGPRRLATGTSEFDLEMSSRPPSFVDTDVAAERYGIEKGTERQASRGLTMNLKSIEEARREEFMSDADAHDVHSPCVAGADLTHIFTRKATDRCATGVSEPLEELKRTNIPNASSGAELQITSATKGVRQNAPGARCGERDADSELLD